MYKENDFRRMPLAGRAEHLGDVVSDSLAQLRLTTNIPPSSIVTSLRLYHAFFSSQPLKPLFLLSGHIAAVVPPPSLRRRNMCQVGLHSKLFIL